MTSTFRPKNIFHRFIATCMAAFVLTGSLEGCKPKARKSKVASSEVAPADRIGFMIWWLTITPHKDTPGDERLQCLYYYENTLKWFSDSEEANGQALFRQITAQTPNGVKFVNARPMTIKQIQDESARVGIVARAFYSDAAKNKATIPSDEELTQNEILVRAVSALDALNRSPVPYTCPEPTAVAAGLQVAEQSDPAKFKVTVVSSEAVMDDQQPIKSGGATTQKSLQLAGASYADLSAPVRWVLGSFGDDGLRTLGNVAKGWAGDVFSIIPSKMGSLVDDTARGVTSIVVRKGKGKAGQIAATEARKAGSIVVRETSEAVLQTAGREAVEAGAGAAAKTGTQAVAGAASSKAIAGASTNGVRQIAAGEARMLVQKPVAVLDDVVNAALKKEIDELPHVVTGAANSQLPGEGARLSARVDRMANSPKFKEYLKNPSNENFAKKFDKLYALVSNSGRDQVEHVARVDVIRRTPKFAKLEAEVFNDLKSIKIEVPRPTKPPIPEPPTGFRSPVQANGTSPVGQNPLYSKVDSIPNAPPPNAPPPNSTSAISDIELYSAAGSLRAPKTTVQADQKTVQQMTEIIDPELSKKSPFQWLQDFWKNKFAKNRARGLEPEKMDVNATEMQGTKPRVSFFGRMFKKKIGPKELAENVDKAKFELAQATTPEAKAAAEAALKTAEEALKLGKGGWVRGARNLAASMAIYSVATPVLQKMAPQIFGAAPGQAPADVTLSAEDGVPWMNAEDQLSELQDPPPPDVDEIKEGLVAAGQALGKDVSVIMTSGDVDERKALALQLETQLQICWPVAVCVASMTATGDLTPCTERTCNDPFLNK